MSNEMTYDERLSLLKKFRKYSDLADSVMFDDVEKYREYSDVAFKILPLQDMSTEEWKNASYEDFL